MTFLKSPPATPDAVADEYAATISGSSLPKYRIPETSSDRRAVFDLMRDELFMDGNSRQNVTTFCTTYANDEVRRLMDLSIALYLIACMLMYAAAIQLRYSAPALPRPFTVPGGSGGMWLTAGIGFAGVLFSFVVSFFPPDQLPVGSPWLYTGLVVLGIVVFAGIPLIIHHVRRSDWATVHDAPLVRPAVIPLK